MVFARNLLIAPFSKDLVFVHLVTKALTVRDSIQEPFLIEILFFHLLCRLNQVDFFADAAMTRSLIVFNTLLGNTGERLRLRRNLLGFLFFFFFDLVIIAILLFDFDDLRLLWFVIKVLLGNLRLSKVLWSVS